MVFLYPGQQKFTECFIQVKQVLQTRFLLNIAFIFIGLNELNITFMNSSAVKVVDFRHMNK